MYEYTTMLEITEPFLKKEMEHVFQQMIPKIYTLYLQTKEKSYKSKCGDVKVIIFPFVTMYDEKVDGLYITLFEKDEQRKQCYFVTVDKWNMNTELTYIKLSWRALSDHLEKYDIKTETKYFELTHKVTKDVSYQTFMASVTLNGNNQIQEVVNMTSFDVKPTYYPFCQFAELFDTIVFELGIGK